MEKKEKENPAKRCCVSVWLNGKEREEKAHVCTLPRVAVAQSG
jgi:hypothetical protein